MPKPKTLSVFANPWHGPIDRNHRACSAVPWDPEHNPDNGLVGAVRRLDDAGELYFEFSQFDHDYALLPDAEAVLLPATDYYKRAIRDGALLAADEATQKLAVGRDDHFAEPAIRVEADRAARHREHERDHGEAPDPNPRPKNGEGRMGQAHAHRPLSSVMPSTGAPGEVQNALKRLMEENARNAKSGDAPQKVGV